MKKLSFMFLSLIMLFTSCIDNEPEIITHFDVDFAASYPTPLPGEIRQTGELDAAREHYINENVKYLVYCDFVSEKKNYHELSYEEKEKEYQRIADCGYELYLAKPWHYQGRGEKVNYDQILLLLKESEFESFSTNPEYGYFFGFVHNGDHSPVNFSDCKKIN